MIKKYRKKPVTIEAVRFDYTDECLQELKEWMGDSMGTYMKHRHINALAELEIVTLEDGTHLKTKHIATEGDYIVKGIAGEFYPVKPGIFNGTYEEVTE